MQRKSLLLCILIFITGNFILAQKPKIILKNKEGWQKIGEVKASFKMEVESIIVMGADKFKSIRLKVTGAPINIESLKVFYASGEVDDIPVKSELMPGDATRVMDVKPQKKIKKVFFAYKTLPNNKNEKAQVELWGLK